MIVRRPDSAVASAWSLFLARTPILVPALAVFIGLPVGEWLATVWPVSAWVFAAAAASALMALALRKWPKRVSSALLCVLFGFSAAFNTGIRTAPISDSLPYTLKSATYGATVENVGDMSERFIAITVKLHAGGDSTTARHLPLRALLHVEDSDGHFIENQLIPGDEVMVTGTLSRLIPGTDFPGETDTKRVLINKGISWSMLLSSSSDTLRMVRRASGFLPMMTRLCLELRSCIDSSPMQSHTKDLLKALLTGDSHAITPAHRQLFSASGLAHLLALSGTHVAVIAFLLNMLLFPLMIWNLGRTRTLLVLTALWGFAFLTGLSASVVRAVVMLTVFAGARMLQRQASSFNSLLVAAVIILMASPGQIHDIGFQLSFGAVAGILLFGKLIGGSRSRTDTTWHRARQALGVSIGANLGTGMTAAYYFHFFPVYFIISNSMAALLVPLFIGLGAIAVTAMLIGWPHSWICQALDLICTGIRWTVGTVASWPGASIDGIYFPAWVTAAYLAALACIKLLTVSRHRHWRAAYAMAASLALGITVTAMANERSVEYPDEWVILSPDTPDSPTIDVVIKRDTSMWLFTTGRPDTHPERLRRISQRLEHYRARCGITSFTMVPESGTARPGEPSCTRTGFLIIGADTLYLPTGHLPLESHYIPSRYIILSGLTHLGNSLGKYTPDTIIIRKHLREEQIRRALPWGIIPPIVTHDPEKGPFRRPLRKSGTHFRKTGM